MISNLSFPLRPSIRLDADEIGTSAQLAHGQDTVLHPAVPRALARLVDSLERSAGLSLRGRLLTRWDLLRLLRNALQVTQAVAERPEVELEPLEQPLVITGLPRSGSTFLHRLLAQDPHNRVPRHWETMRPVHRSQNATRLRAATRMELRCARLLAPGLAAIHPLSPDTPQECTEITSHCLMSLRFDSTHDVPDYRLWLDQQDPALAFAYHRRVLQLLQSVDRNDGQHPPRRWVLKSPDHLFTLFGLGRVYPDHRMVVTHRDALDVLPSVAHLTCALHRMFSDRVDPAHIGAKVLARWAEGATLTAELARAPGVLCLGYSDIVYRPLETVRAIYQFMQWELTEPALARMRAFVRKHPRGDYGDNRYSAETYGLRPSRIAARFAGYHRAIGEHLHRVPTAPAAPAAPAPRSVTAVSRADLAQV